MLRSSAVENSEDLTDLFVYYHVLTRHVRQSIYFVGNSMAGWLLLYADGLDQSVLNESICNTNICCTAHYLITHEVYKLYPSDQQVPIYFPIRHSLNIYFCVVLM